MNNRVLILISIIVAIASINCEAQTKPIRRTNQNTQITKVIVKGESEFKRAHKYLDNGDNESFILFLEKAADLGNSKALYDLGLMYENGFIGQEYNYGAAIECYNKVHSKKELSVQASNRVRRLRRLMELWGINNTNKFKTKKFDLGAIYYPKYGFSLTRDDKVILRVIANIMKSHPLDQFVLTVWADNYTGTDDSNEVLRNNRLIGVRDFLLLCKVMEEQLRLVVESNNLTDYGAKWAEWDRAVTIRIAD